MRIKVTFHKWSKKRGRKGRWLFKQTMPDGANINCWGSIFYNQQAHHQYCKSSMKNWFIKWMEVIYKKMSMTGFSSSEYHFAILWRLVITETSERRLSICSCDAGVDRPNSLIRPREFWSWTLFYSYWKYALSWRLPFLKREEKIFHE